MVVEEFIQRVFASFTSEYNLPFYDVIPTKTSALPAIMLQSIQRLKEKACSVECRATVNIYSGSSTKKELYELAEGLIQIIPKIGGVKIENCDFVWCFSQIEGTETQTFNPINQAGAGIEIWHVYTIRFQIQIDKKCGQKI